MMDTPGVFTVYFLDAFWRALFSILFYSAYQLLVVGLSSMTFTKQPFISFIHFRLVEDMGLTCGVRTHSVSIALIYHDTRLFRYHTIITYVRVLPS